MLAIFAVGQRPLQEPIIVVHFVEWFPASTFSTCNLFTPKSLTICCEYVRLTFKAVCYILCRQVPDPLKDGLFRHLMNAVSFIVALLPMVPGEFWFFNPIPLRFYPFAPRHVFGSSHFIQSVIVPPVLLWVLCHSPRVLSVPARNRHEP